MAAQTWSTWYEWQSGKGSKYQKRDMVLRTKVFELPVPKTSDSAFASEMPNMASWRWTLLGGQQNAVIKWPSEPDIIRLLYSLRDTVEGKDWVAKQMKQCAHQHYQSIESFIDYLLCTVAKCHSKNFHFGINQKMLRHQFDSVPIHSAGVISIL